MRDYLPTLDGWRAIAITLVLFTHVRLPGNALQPIAPYGAMGVHLFFAISGFLITNRLLEDRTGLRAFYIRRAFRILPAAFLYLAVLCVLSFVGGWIPLNAGQVMASAFFYRNYYVLPAAQGWYTGHYWSLSVEEHFYLLWPALLLWLGVRRARWAAPALACAFASWRGLDTHFGWVAAWNPAWKDLVERTDYRLDGLFWGCAAALLWDWRPARLWLATRGRSEYALLAVAAIIVLLVLQPPGFVAMFAFLMPLPLLFTAAKPQEWLGRLLELRPAVWFGRISYSVYVWQMLFLVTYGIPLSLGWAQRFPVNLVLILAPACASYYLVERPLRRIGRQWSRLRTLPAAAPMSGAV
jgi:peptidoglycan/LPS O-acetylase OafA/YrhL